jgi:nitrogen fixation protein NifU and related proteins
MGYEQMYMEDLLDHYKNPRNSGAIENADIKYKDSNPICGDVVNVSVKLNKDRIDDVKFLSKGCAISVAASSKLSAELKNKSLKNVEDIENQFVFDLLGVEISPMRVKCALLGLKALQKGVRAYRK